MAAEFDLVLRVIVTEPPERKRRRVKREIERVGYLRFLDVLAYRLAHRVAYAASDAAWYSATLRALRDAHPEPACRDLHVAAPSEQAVADALRETGAEFAIARVKSLINQRVFTVPPHGVFVLHPGICPEYRNAHGGFWALANREPHMVGTTMLRIDAGVDTGPIFGWFRAPFDTATDSHLVIQDRTLFANLPAVADTFRAVFAGTATPADVRGRPSGAWGQPWFTRWLGIRRNPVRYVP